MSRAKRLYDLLPVPVQNVATTGAGWLNTRRRYGPHFRETLENWEAMADAGLEELHEIQQARLARILDVARRHSPYYRDLPPMADHPDPAESIRRTLDRIEPLEKSVLRERTADFYTDHLPARRIHRAQTSGTTGTPLALRYSREALAEEYATVWRMRRSVGVAFGSPHLTFGGQIVVPISQTRPPFHRRDVHAGQTIFSLYHVKSENLPSYVDAIHAAEATYAQGYPSFLYQLARAMLDMDRPLPVGRLKAIFTSSESLLAFQRETIEAGFGAPIYDRYGASELAVSMTQGADRRLYVDMEFCIVEVEPEEEDDERVRGTLLVTGLSNEAMPLIRYRIGDTGTLLKKPKDACRAGMVFESVDGRIEDYTVTPDGRTIGRLDHVFKNQPGVAEAQILQNTKEALKVLVVPTADWNASCRDQLLRGLRSRLGNEMAIDVDTVEQIGRDGEKFRFVRSEVGRLQTTRLETTAHEPELRDVDYTGGPLTFRAKKGLRYLRLYGVQRTIAKIRGQYHLRRRYEQLPPTPVPGSDRAHVGIIGCGGFAFSTIGYFLTSRRGKVVRAAMDTDIHRAASLFEQYGAHYYTDRAEPLFEDPAIDLIFIASNHASHADYAIAALRAGKHVHIEKPHVTTEAQLVALCREMQRSGRRVTLGFNRNESPFADHIREALGSQTGPAVMNWAVIGHKIPEDHWYAREEEGGRVFGNLCHWTDFVYGVMPPEDRYPIRIQPTTGRTSDSEIAVTYTFGDGSVAAITFSATGHTFEGVRERFTAQRGDVIMMLDDFEKLQIEHGDRREVHRSLFRDPGHKLRIERSYALSDASGNTPQPCSLRYVWESAELFLRTKQALDSGTTLVVQPFSEERLDTGLL